SSIRRASRSRVGTTCESGHRCCSSATTCAYPVSVGSIPVSSPSLASRPAHRPAPGDSPALKPTRGRRAPSRPAGESGPGGVMREPDQVVFRGGGARAPGERRSRARARALLGAAGLDSPGPPVLTVVGSKGKGTAAVYASAYLCAAGRRVVTVTSPSLWRTTERIRVDGVPVDEATLAALGDRLAALRPGRTAGAGYLSPSGLFLLAGLVHARDVAADAVVLEAGKGGRSDEVSLVDPTVVAVAPIFAEHLGELGGSVEAVVADKLGVVRPRTRAVVIGTRPEPTWRRIRDRVAAQTGGALTPVEAAADPAAGAVGSDLLPPGLGAANARLGCVAASHLLAAAPPAAALRRVLGTVRLPGRLSDRKSTRLNSSHVKSSYAVFCL